MSCLGVLGSSAWAAAPTTGNKKPVAASSPILRVGPSREIKTLAEAARQVQDGTTIEVDAGDYIGDVAVWDKRDLYFKATGGRVKLSAAGASAEGKAIWVVRGGKTVVEGFDFTGATVPSRNGAGIRLERGWLVVRDCSFIANENGILTGNRDDIRLEIENSEFGHNGFGDGQSHNLYAGEIAYLSVMGSYFHHANVGHLLKSRAAFNDIRYNRLADEADGQASYELEFAAGGMAYVIGNIIQQSSATNNPHLISYGAEGFRWPSNELYLVHNTLVDDRPQGGVLLRVRLGSHVVRAENNLIVGTEAPLDVGDAGSAANNARMARSSFGSASPNSFRLTSANRPAGQWNAVQPANGIDLNPRREFTFPRGTRALLAKPRLPGAMQ